MKNKGFIVLGMLTGMLLTFALLWNGSNRSALADVNHCSGCLNAGTEWLLNG